MLAAGCGSKRGGGKANLPLDEADAVLPAPEKTEELLALDEALGRLETAAPELARVVEWRFFAGLSVEDIAKTLEVSDRTVAAPVAGGAGVSLPQSRRTGRASRDRRIGSAPARSRRGLRRARRARARGMPVPALRARGHRPGALPARRRLVRGRSGGGCVPRSRRRRVFAPPRGARRGVRAGNRRRRGPGDRTVRSRLAPRSRRHGKRLGRRAARRAVRAARRAETAAQGNRFGGDPPAVHAGAAGSRATRPSAHRAVARRGYGG